MTFSIDNPRGVATTPLGKYVWEKPSGEQGLRLIRTYWAEIEKVDIFATIRTYWAEVLKDPQLAEI